MFLRRHPSLLAPRPSFGMRGGEEKRACVTLRTFRMTDIYYIFWGWGKLERESPALKMEKKAPVCCNFRTNVLYCTEMNGHERQGGKAKPAWLTGINLVNGKR